MKTFVGVTTFNKPDILKDFLESLPEFGYTKGNVIAVADDSPGETLEICKNFSFVQAYLTGDVHGIFANKNRLLKYFYEETNCERCILFDHDIVFTREGLLEEFEAASTADRQQHINGFVVDADERDGLEISFSIKNGGESDHIRYAEGCHGIALWFTRDLLKKVGYISKFPFFYGYEHSDLSTRALMAQGYCPTLYPTLKKSTRFFKLNPNDYHKYDVDIQKTYAENAPIFHARLEQTARGVNLKEYKHSLRNELSITQEGMNFWSSESIKSSLKKKKK